MRLAITGGGTGGHIYPALEVAKLARDMGAEVQYLGSFRGQEQAIATAQDFKFQGFPAQPLYSLRQVRGWKSLLSLLQATFQAKKHLRAEPLDAIFSTGGYSAAPVMAAAKSLGIPLVIHESNTVPGRSNRMFATYCRSFTCAFEKTLSVIPNAIRTGQPIRKELRLAAQAHRTSANQVLAIGGSQGSVFVNELVTASANSPENGWNWLLAAGKSNAGSVSSGARLTVVPYLETNQLAEAYQNAPTVVARSGGTIAEFAMFGLPSVLIPLPTAADDHQTANAQEFVDIGGAKLLKQSEATPRRLIEQIGEWLADSDRYLSAQKALRDWDRPLATESILETVVSAAKSRN